MSPSGVSAPLSVGSRLHELESSGVSCRFRSLDRRMWSHLPANSLIMKIYM